METAAAETEQAESRLVAEETATRNRGEDTIAAAALNLDECVSTTAAQNLGEDRNAAVACNLIEDTNPQQPKKKQRTEVTSRSQGNKNKWNNEGDDEIRRLMEERRNTAKGDKPQLKELSKRIKKCIRERQEKTQRILEEFRGIKSMSSIKSGRKRTLIRK